jgi:S1/P1 Nuclease
MQFRIFALALFFISPALGWWCEGHEAVAYVAEKHLTPAASAAVTKLLKAYPAEAPRACQDPTQDLMAIASTWADDVKKSEKTGPWHYMDIPMGLKKGDPEAYCAPIGPSVNGADRTGCILSALRSMVNILHSEKESDEEKATALRYLIHFVGDLHQPLHTTSNNDGGGNCTPVQFFDDRKISNLHSVWDGQILNRDLADRKETLAQLADRVDREYASKEKSWIKDAPEFDKWAWESHLIADKVTYGDLEPKVPVEKYDPRPQCDVERDRFGALHITAGEAYEKAVAPVVEEQLAKAGYRLAAILNLLFG